MARECELCFVIDFEGLFINKNVAQADGGVFIF